MKCSCDRDIHFSEPIWRCHDCRLVVCKECISAKTANRLEFLCPGCASQRTGKIVKIRRGIKGSPDGAFVAWVLIDKNQDIMMFEVCGKIMMGYHKHIDNIVKMSDILLQDRLLLLSRFYIGREYIPDNIEYPPLSVRANETDIEVIK